jgi:hypothetical protein
MDTQSVLVLIEPNAALAPPASYPYWFVFTYFPPALRAGREARMR